MRLLLKTVLHYRKHYFVMVLTLLSMLGMTIGTQMEIFSLGVITRNGADFFQLFAPGKEEVSLQAVEEKWPLIANGSDVIHKKAASNYLASAKGEGVLEYFSKKLDLANSIKAFIFLLIGISIFKALAIFGTKYFAKVVSIRVSRDLRQRYFEYIQNLPMSFYGEHNIGSLSSRVVGDAMVVATAINHALINYVQTPFLFLSSLAICFALSWQLSVIIFVGLPLLVLPIVYLARRVKKVSRHILKNQENFTSVLVEFLAGIQTVKIFRMEAFSVQKYRVQNDQMARLEEKNAKYDSIARPILHMLGGLCIAVIIFLGIYVLGMSISALIVFCGIAFQLYEPIKKFGEENAQIQKGIVAAERMFEVLHLVPAIQDDPEAVPLEERIHTIEFKEVWFRYEEEWVLKGVSFSLAQGETLAIVGPTGAGKSTIAQLLPRLYEIEKGEILINGRPLRYYTQHSIREAIAYVPQKPFLFLDTIRENIAFGRYFSNEAIRSAAKRAHAEEFIEQLSEGYEAMVAEGGKNFSGGQVQRLAIARALVKEGSLLIMDEATSSLDTISENAIKEAIFSVKGEMAQIIIAHRLSTIEKADKILYLEKGEKIGEGSFEALQEACPPFAQMCHYYRSLA